MLRANLNHALYELKFKTNISFTVVAKKFSPVRKLRLNVSGKCPNFGHGYPNLGHTTIYFQIYFKYISEYIALTIGSNKLSPDADICFFRPSKPLSWHTWMKTVVDLIHEKLE